MSEAEGYHQAQVSAAKLTEFREDKAKVKAKYQEEFEEKLGEGSGLAEYLAECKMSGRRAEARQAIREAAGFGDQRIEMGWSDETIDSRKARDLLNMFHSSRRKGERRKRKGERK